MQHSNVNKMSQPNSNQTVKFKRMKQLFLLFLKQFEVDDYKLLIQFLQLIIKNYNLNPSKLFGFLTNQNDNSIENELNQPIAGLIRSIRLPHKHHTAPAKPMPLIKLNKKIKYSSPLSYYNKHRRNFLIKEHQFKLKELNRLANNKRKQINQLNNLQSSNLNENQPDQEDIQYFNDNQDDNEINFECENYQPDTLEVPKRSDLEALDLNTLSNRNEIIDAFILKDDEDDEEEEDDDDIIFDEGEDEFWSSNAKSSSQKDDAKVKSSSATSGPVNDSKSSNRIRKFSEHIRYELERKFLSNHFISGAEKSLLAKQLNLTERQVQKWFVHRREKLRRLEKKATLLNSTLLHQRQQHQQHQQNHLQHQQQQRPVIQINRMKNSNSTHVPSASSFSQSATSKKPENPYQKIYLTKAGTSNSSNRNNYSNKYNQEQHVDDNESDIECLTDNNANETDDFTNENENEMNYNEMDNENHFANANDDEPDLVPDEYDDTEDFRENTSNEYSLSGELNENNSDMYDDGTGYMDESNCHSDNITLSQLIAGNKTDANQVGFNSQNFSKGPRRLFPPHVITHLEKIFDTEKYLKDNQVTEIARVTKLNEKQIRSWFKQRRYRYNQENKLNGVDIDFGFKKRDNLSQSVVNELEKAFLKNNYVYGDDKKTLSRKLNLKPIQLERWFYYRRKKQSNNNNSAISNETF